MRSLQLSNRNGISEFYNTPNAEPDEKGLITRAVVPLQGMVIFPNVVSPLFLENPKAVEAAEAALNDEETVIGLAQRDPTVSDPGPEDIYTVGTEIALGKILKMPDDSNSVLAQGRRRVEVIEFTQTEPYLIARVRVVEEEVDRSPEKQAMMKAVVNLFKRAVDLNANVPEDILVYAINTDDPGWLSDLVTSTLSLNTDESQRVLEMFDTSTRLNHVAMLLGKELSVLELEDEISTQVQLEMERSQREMYLREQMRVIQTELGEGDVFQEDLNDLREQIAAANLPGEVHDRSVKELSRLSMMPPIAPETSMIRSYIEWLTSIPWNNESEDNLDVRHAQKILDEEHYGLPKVKDRILEYIAVRKLAQEKMDSPILCFVGPPGVGKTSMGKSIAHALGREFVRVSLGGVRDEAEIRGHRRTYIGALPGRIIQTMKRAGTTNPVFMLDEIDKLGADFRGDPADSLLEVLDPEQNNAFSDHYMEVPYDLSKVLFITTANDLDPLPPALLDRLEIIEFPGYLEEEKIAIAYQFLIPDQLETHGLQDQEVHFELSTLQTIIREYTYEAGVRNLKREIANVCRKVARLVAEEKRYPHTITPKHVTRYLGPPYYIGTRTLDEDTVGVATGLVWTYGGGDITLIEVSLLPGKGNLTMTGNLGDVMQESAQAALSYVRSRAEEFDVPSDDFEDYDIHVHIPEGAVPKEGPSAGITLATAIMSAFTERKIRSDFAMTGEITLRGKVLPVGGVKEKVMAARRALIKNIILPAHNEKDLQEIPRKALRDLNMIFVDNMQQVFDHVLLDPPAEGRKRDLNREEDDDEELTEKAGE
ncbi:MAG: endopeptidase La [Anaerolineae bacterium]|nr:endopeptidase La [Anaerolineae bacterium]